jgi:hypothetical protein
MALGCAGGERAPAAAIDSDVVVRVDSTSIDTDASVATDSARESSLSDVGAIDADAELDADYPIEKNVGSLNVYEIAGASPMIAASGAFFASRPTCRKTTLTSCDFLECPGTTIKDPASSAGEVRLTGTGISAMDELLNRSATNIYSRVIALPWPAAGSWTVSATGADVPAFTATLSPPSSITTTSPMCVSGKCGAIDATKDFTVSWSGGTTGIVEVDIGGGNRVIACRAAATVGTLVVPKAALSLLPLGSHIFGTVAQASVVATVGSWTVTFAAHARGSNGDLVLK